MPLILRSSPLHTHIPPTGMSSPLYSGSSGRDSHRDRDRGHRYSGGGGKRSRERSRERGDTSTISGGSSRHQSSSPRRRSKTKDGHDSFTGGRPSLGGSSSSSSSSVSSHSRPPIHESSSSGGSSSSSNFRRTHQPPPLSPETRLAYFIKSCAFLVALSKELNLGKVATHTALVFFHRFFKHQSFQAHDRLLVATACIYLAAKTEERNNVKLSIIVVQYLKKIDALPDEVDPLEYNRNAVAREAVPAWKARVISYERCLLYTIAFDLTVTHPFRALQDMMKTVRDVMAEEGRKGGPGGGGGGATAIGMSAGSGITFSSSLSFPHQQQQQQQPFDHRTFFSQACKFLNDSFCLPSLIDVEPSYSAALALYLTTLLYGIKPPTNKGTWLEIFQVQDEARFLSDCSLAIQTYGEENSKFQNLNVVDVPEPSSVPSAVTRSAAHSLELEMSSLYGGGGLRRLSPLL